MYENIKEVEKMFKIFYMIDYVVKSGLENISMNTNATLMDGEMAENAHEID